MGKKLLYYLVLIILFANFRGAKESAESSVPTIMINPLGHSGKINQILYAPAGDRIITVSEDKSIRVWDPVQGEEIKSFYLQKGEGPAGMFYSAAISKDGKYLAVSGYPVITESGENYINVIDLEQEKQIATAKGHTNVINTLAFSGDGGLLVSGSDDATIKVWDFQDKDNLKELATISVDERVNKVSFSPDGYRLAVASDDSHVRIYDMRMARQGYAKTDYDELKGHKDAVKVVKFSPGGKYIVSAGADSRIILWNSEGKEIKEIDKLLYPINTLTFSHDDQILVAMTDVEGKGRSYSLPAGTMFTEFKGHDNTVLSADFSPTSLDGNYLVASAGGSNNEIIIWNAISGKTMTDLKGKGSIVWHARFGEKYKVYLSKTPIESASSNTYAITFDFSHLTINETVGDIDFASSSDPQNRFNITDNYKMITPSGRLINNDPGSDGRMLSYAVNADDNVIIGSDFSLKAYNVDGVILREFLGHTGGIRDVSISTDGAYLISASEDQTLKLWDLKSKGKMISVWEYFDDPEFRSFMKDVGLEESAKKENSDGWEEVIAFLDDEGYRVVRDVAEVYQVMPEFVNPVATLFVADDMEWVCWTPEGYFSCSSRGAEYFGWHINKGINNLAEFYTAEQYFDILYQPELVAESVIKKKSVTRLLKEKGEKPFDLTKLKKPSAAFFNKPALPEGAKGELTYKNRIFSTPSKKVIVNVDAFDGGGGIKELRVYQNGKLIVSDSVKILNQDSTRLTYEVNLVNGPNIFKTMVVNYQNIESRPDRLEVLYSGEHFATSDMYIFAVGINQYKNARYNLNYAQPDAQSFVEELIKHNKKLFRRIETLEIYDENGTKENIFSVFDSIKVKAKPEDVFVFYYAGHGSIDPDDPNGEYFLVPHDVTKIYGDKEQLLEKAISATELKDQLADIKPQKQLILLDACHSGGAVKSLTRAAASEEKAIFQLARSAGVVLIAASGTEQFATEFEVLKHGVFTYALLEGLNGKADGLQDQKITVGELRSYMEDRVPELSALHGGQAQYPTGYSSGQDFPISLVDGEYNGPSAGGDGKGEK